MKLKNLQRFMVSLLMLLLVACCSGIDEGVVISKEHHKAWTEPSMMLIGGVMMPHVIDHPERWTLNIANYGKEKHCDVSKERFDSTAIGDWIKCS
jgi:hypothetical protein